MSQMKINQQLMIEAQQDNVRLRRDLTEARTETRQMRQLVEELQETVRHYQQAERGMGPAPLVADNGDGTKTYTIGAAWVGGQMVEIP